MNRRLVAAALVLAWSIGSIVQAAPARWSIAVCGQASDPRQEAVADAVEFWNGQLASMHAALSLGPVAPCDRTVPDEVLTRMSEGVLNAGGSGGFPTQLEGVRADLIVVLSGAELVSVGMRPARGRPGLVILRRPDVPPLSLPNVARNVAAHEIGHAIGLPHNSDPSTLMCGRPAPCRPALFQSATKRFFPLTAEDINNLRNRYR